MATIQKTTTDLVVIKGTSAQRTETVQTLINTAEAIYFETDTHRLYVGDSKGNVKFGSNVDDIVVDDTGKLTITYADGTEKGYDLAIDSALTTLKEEILQEVSQAYIPQTAIVTTPGVNSTEAQVLSAKGGYVLLSEINAAKVLANSKVSSVGGNLVKYKSDMSGTPDKSVVNINFFADYDDTNNVINFYAGTDINGTLLCSIDTTDFVYKGMIDDVTFDPNTKELTIDFNTNAGIQDIKVDMSALVDVYEGEGCIKVDNFKISLNYDADVFEISSDKLTLKVSYLNQFLRDNAVTSIDGKHGVIDFAVSKNVYYASDPTPETDVQMPFPTVVLESKEFSGNANLDAEIAATANPANILANLAWLLQQHPELTDVIEIKGANIGYDTTSSTGKFDFAPKWYKISNV